MEWCDCCAVHGPLSWRSLMEREAEMIRTDAGRTFGFVRVIAGKS
jgi:hypothetical protein